MGFIVGVVIVYQILYKDVSDPIIWLNMPPLRRWDTATLYLFRLVLQESLLLSLCGYVPALLICAILYNLTQSATGLLMELQPIEALSSTEKILKAALRTAFKIFSGF